MAALACTFEEAFQLGIDEPVDETRLCGWRLVPARESCRSVGSKKHPLGRHHRDATAYDAGGMNPVSIGKGSPGRDPLADQTARDQVATRRIAYDDGGALPSPPVGTTRANSSEPAR